MELSSKGVNAHHQMDNGTSLPMSSDKALIMAPHFFPNIQYLTKLLDAPLLVLDSDTPFQKQSYLNRAYIIGANKVLRLTVPLEQNKTYQPLKTATIDHKSNWARKTWTAIASAYGKTPYFPFFAGEVESLLKQRHKYLLDLNIATLELITRAFSLTPTYQWLSGIEHFPDEVSDWRTAIRPRNSAGTDPEFTPRPYPQAFEYKFGFISNLSGLDLLFNLGPEGKEVLRKSKLT